jgi:hypothetical protein
MDSRCGAQTTNGGACKNKGSPCWHHKGPQCSVCFAPMTRGVRELPCGHSFHVKCIDRWKKNCPYDFTCPMCREPFDLPVFKCRMIIQRVSNGEITFEDSVPTNIQQTMQIFGLDLRQLSPDETPFTADILFDIENGEDIEEELRELGIVHFRLPA